MTIAEIITEWCEMIVTQTEIKRKIPETEIAKMIPVRSSSSITNWKRGYQAAKPRDIGTLAAIVNGVTGKISEKDILKAYEAYALDMERRDEEAELAYEQKKAQALLENKVPTKRKGIKDRSKDYEIICQAYEHGKDEHEWLDDIHKKMDMAKPLEIQLHIRPELPLNHINMTIREVHRFMRNIKHSPRAVFPEQTDSMLIRAADLYPTLIRHMNQTLPFGELIQAVEDSVKRFKELFKPDDQPQYKPNYALMKLYLGDAYAVVGSFKYNERYLQKALTYHLEAKRLDNSAGKKTAARWTPMLIYAHLGDHENYKKSEALAIEDIETNQIQKDKDAGDLKWQVAFFSNLGRCRGILCLDGAEEAFQKSEQALRKLKIKEKDMFGYKQCQLLRSRLIAMAHSPRRDKKLAQTWYKEAKDYCEINSFERRLEEIEKYWGIIRDNQPIPTI